MGMVARRERLAKGLMMPRAAKSLPPSSSKYQGVSTELVKLLDDKFAAHENRSTSQIKELKGELSSLIKEQEKKADDRHQQTTALLSDHTAKLDVHHVKIQKIEETTKELHQHRQDSHAEWKRWGLGLLTLAIATAITTLLSLLKGH